MTVHLPVSTLLALTPLFAACDMEPAEVLDAPRVLAVRTEPAALSPGEPHVLEALAFTPPDRAPAELAWSACPVAWRPTDPPTCPDDGAITLGRGNPLTATLPSELDSLWLRVEPVDGAALPAMKRLEAGVEAENPSARGVATPAGELPGTITVGAPLELVITLGGDADPSALVVSWYVTAGELEPARTLASDPATLVADAPGPLEVIAVVREPGGGTAWTSARFEVTP
ncbi:MAG: hypothetical protein IT385_20310 [Deltaproteobacteria bacterium]|nr:hypothetical protein [Deltaproteobacteria bacterium]